MTGCITVNHEILNAFVERYHSDTSSFHLPLGEMFITLDGVSCLLHLLIRGKLLDHGRISKDETLVMMVDYLRVDLADVMAEMDGTRGAHARFKFLKKVCTYELQRVKQAKGDDEHVGLHITYSMREYLLYFVGTVIFVDKSSAYTDVIYLQYFEDFEWIHEYNWGAAYLVYLYSKLSGGYTCKTKQVTCSITLLTIIFIGLLMFLFPFHFIFTTPLLMIHVFQTFQTWILQQFPRIFGRASVPTYIEDMSYTTAFSMLRRNHTI